MTKEILRITNLTKLYGSQIVLNQLSLSLSLGDRVALVGENGVGKTTLARIILGIEEPDSGAVHFSNQIDIGYLPQEIALGTDGALSVRQYLEGSLNRSQLIAEELRSLENQLSSNTLSASQLAEKLTLYGELQEEHERKGGYELDYRVDMVLAGLGLAELDEQRSLLTLSGGEKTRVVLASLLLRSPDFLILDEPTNHLDFAALEWLESYLVRYRSTLLVISHDRYFLNKTVSMILELSPVDHQLTVYNGNYDYYLAEQEKRYQRQLAEFEERREEIRELQRLIKAKTFSTRSGRGPTDNDKLAHDYRGQRSEKSVGSSIKAAKNRLEELQEEQIEAPVARWAMNPEFRPAELGSEQVLQFINVSKRYGDKVLFEGVSKVVRNGERIVITGSNGSGKSTLFKIIIGLVQPDKGEVIVARNAKIGYLDQEQESLNWDNTVLEEYCQGLAGEESSLRSSLHKFGLFQGDQVFQRIASLSVGQRRKLQIAKLISTRANILILDEPTNHLDLSSLEQFEQALCEFGGTVLAISHDRWFINRVATEVWRLDDGEIHVAD